MVPCWPPRESIVMDAAMFADPISATNADVTVTQPQDQYTRTLPS